FPSPRSSHQAIQLRARAATLRRRESSRRIRAVGPLRSEPELALTRLRESEAGPARLTARLPQSVRVLVKHSPNVVAVWRDSRARSLPPGQIAEPDRQAAACFAAIRILRDTPRNAAVQQATVCLRRWRPTRSAV